MTTVTVYGASDDLIEVEGGIIEEFGYRSTGIGDLVAFSDGTLLRVHFTGAGVWRITVVARGSAEVSISQAPEGAADDYTDRATVSGNIYWAVHGIGLALARGGSS